MPEKTLTKSALFALFTVILVIIGWEISLRSQGYGISYDDDSPLWSEKRGLVYAPADQAVVFVGSSRNKYDLDIETWKNLTGCQAIQLAIEGSCPRPVLEDLANDPNFKGRIILDVTEGLFFSNDVGGPKRRIKYFHDRTPAQRVSFELNQLLESKLVFLDKKYFSLNARLDQLKIPSRQGVFMMPIWPIGFNLTSADRQNIMTDVFVRDTAMQNEVKDIWYFFYEGEKKDPPLPEEELAKMFQSVKESIDKIKSRGGQVLFLRTPSTNYPGEENFPRDKYWEKLLTLTGCQGIHYADDPIMSQLKCPELSHLAPADAIVFTQRLVDILQKDKGWRFQKG